MKRQKRSPFISNILPHARYEREGLNLRLRPADLNFGTARGYAMQALHSHTSVARKQATLHRVARLDRKIESRSIGALF